MDVCDVAYLAHCVRVAHAQLHAGLAYMKLALSTLLVLHALCMFVVLGI